MNFNQMELDRVRACAQLWQHYPDLMDDVEELLSHKVRAVADRRMIHGSEVQNLRATDNDFTCRLLITLMLAGYIKPHHPAPTHSQQVLMSQQLGAKGFREYVKALEPDPVWMWFAVCWYWWPTDECLDLRYTEHEDNTWCYTCDRPPRMITGSSRYCAECNKKA